MRSVTQKLYDWAVIILFSLGVILSLISIGAELLGIDLTPGFGMAQMFQLLIGLTLLTLAGYLHVFSQRLGQPRSLQADIGVRLGATGLVFAFVAGLADLLGIGTHVNPNFARPYVGPLQLGGLMVGILLIIAGIIMYHTSRGYNHTSSLQFLIKEEGEG